MHNRPTLSRPLSLFTLCTLCAFLAGCVGQVTEPSASTDGETMTPDDGTTTPPDDPTTPPGDPTTPPGDPPVGTPTTKVSLAYTESSAELVNPERGFYVGLDLLNPGGAAQVRASGHSLAITLVRLDAYRGGPLDAALLAKLEQGFAAARAAGLKVILRFTYNSSFAADAPKSVILGHIGQLAPVLRNNVDVIAVMQAGFIGAWGEWHTSTNGLDNDGDRAAILTAILNALPASRAVQVRTPMAKAGIFAGGPIPDSEAFSGSNRARVGHHNDCFLASDSDFGTYASPVATWESFIAQESKFTPMGGETCAVSARTACAVAVAEMESNHWSYLNREYQQDVINGWEAQGCGAEIRKRLGYRFALKSVVHDEVVAPGGALALDVEINNSGFAAPYNARPIYLVLSGGGKRRVVKLNNVDVRRWQRGTVTKLTVKVRVPADASPGAYKLALWLPDDATALRDDARYAIRLANDGLWDAATGDNLLSDKLVIDASAGGAVDSSATELVVLP